MNDITQVISTIAIFALLGMSIYLSLRKNRLVIAAVGHLIMGWLAFLLTIIAVARVIVLFDPHLEPERTAIVGFAFIVTVIGIIVSVVRYERTH